MKGAFSHVVISLIAWGYSVVAQSTHPLIHFSFISYSVYFFLLPWFFCCSQARTNLGGAFSPGYVQEPKGQCVASQLRFEPGNSET